MEIEDQAVEEETDGLFDGVEEETDDAALFTDDDPDGDDDPDDGDDPESDDDPDDSKVVAKAPDAPEDPGDPPAEDQTVEVTTFGEDGKGMQTHQVKNRKEWLALIRATEESGRNFSSTAQMLEAHAKVEDMESDRRNTKAEYDKKAEAFKTYQETQDQLQQELDAWQREMDFLVAEKALPKLTKAQQQLDWNVPANRKDPAIKAHYDLIQFMRTENDKRVQAGIKPLSSLVDAWEKLETQNLKLQKSKDKVAGVQARKKASSRVMGASSNPPMGKVKGEMVGSPGLF